jgi:Holliday junction DNA helicase RuvA
VLVSLSVGGITVERGGIGFRMVCANPFGYESQINEEITVYIYQYVREDALMLYGFRSRKTRDLFARLLSVSGIGPKNALAVLATDEPERIVQAVETEDVGYLTRFPGIGKKTAGRMILDLKGKLGDIDGLRPAGPSSPAPAASALSSALGEALEALRMLGYTDKEIGRCVPVLKKQEMSAENYIREALRLLTK